MMRSSFLVLLLTALFTLGHPDNAICSDNASLKALNQLLQEGGKLRSAQEYKKALEIYEKALTLDLSKSRKAIIYHFLARTYADLSKGELVVSNLAKFIDAARSFDENNETDRYIYTVYHIHDYLREARGFLTILLRKNPPGGKTIGIMGIQGDKEGLAQITENGFLEFGPFGVVEMGYLEEILKDQSLSLSAVKNDSTAIALGKKAGISYAVTGTVKELKDHTIRFKIKLFDTETGELISEVSDKAAPDKISVLGKSITSSLCADYFIKNIH